MSDDSEEYGGKLLIYNVKVEDGGDYECYLQNSHKSSRVKLQVEGPAHQNLIRESHVEREVDSNVELKCEVANNMDRSYLRWRKLNGVFQLFIILNQLKIKK
jgi:hypothetical protein